MEQLALPLRRGRVGHASRGALGSVRACGSQRGGGPQRRQRATSLGGRRSGRRRCAFGRGTACAPDGHGRGGVDRVGGAMRATSATPSCARRGPRLTSSATATAAWSLVLRTVWRSAFRDRRCATSATSPSLACSPLSARVADALVGPGSARIAQQGPGPVSRLYWWRSMLKVAGPTIGAV